MRARPLARALALAIALLAMARPALATLNDAPVVSLVDPAAVLDPTTRELALRFEAGRGVVTDVSLELDGVPGVLLSPSRISTTGSPVTLRFAIARQGAPRRLLVRYRFDGAEHVQAFDLSADAPDVQTWRVSDAARREGTAAAGRIGRVATPSSTQATSIHVHGRLLVTRSDGTSLPVDSALVQVYDHNAVVWDTFLGGVATGPDGRYDLTFSWPVCGLCEAHPDVYLKVSSTCSMVSVQDAISDDPLVWLSPVKEDADSAGDVNLGDMTMRNASAFEILTSLVRAHDWMKALGYDIPRVMCRIGSNVHTDYLPSSGIIEVQTGDQSKQWAIIHEYGHHWQQRFAPTVAHYSYTNGVCDTTAGQFHPGHCFGCAEEPVAGWIEGFADWFATDFSAPWQAATGLSFISTGYPPSFENWRTCTEPHGSTFPAAAEESHVAALLNDFADFAPDDEDPGLGSDLIAYGDTYLYGVIATAHPDSVEQLYRLLVGTRPADTRSLWRTALNNQMDFDHNGPAAPTGLVCTDHTISVGSPDATLNLTWTRSVDDGSGVRGYSIKIDPSTSPPDTVMNLADVTTARSQPLAPGFYYVSLRALDWSGHWGPPTSPTGPYVVQPAGAPDLISYAPAGWHSPYVPRQTADATESSVPAPTFLVGGQTTYTNEAWANIGTGATPTGTFYYMIANGAWSGAYTQEGISLPPGYYDDTINHFVGQFPGGLHTIALLPDGAETIAEADETNNVWGEQWAFSPKDITNAGPLAFPRPPYELGGMTDVTDGAPFYDDCYAFRVLGGAVTSAVTLRAKGSEDVDLRYHPTYVGPKDGYQSVIASSEQIDDLDAILIPEGSSGTWDFSVTRAGFAAATDSFIIHHVTSSAIPFGSNQPAAIALNQSMVLFTTDVPANAPVCQVTLTAPAGSQLRLAVLDLPEPLGLVDAIAVQAGVDDSGLAFLGNITAPGQRIAYAVYREPDWGANPISFTVKVSPASTDLGPTYPVGWDAPLVPRGDAAGTDTSVPAPTTLPGDANSTHLNVAVQNNSPTPEPAQIVPDEIRLDGSLLTTLLVDSIPAGGLKLMHPASLFTVRGGRHVMSSAVDPANTLHETNVANNVYGDSWVWAPATLGIGATTTRAAPPPASGGWADLTATTDRFPNCDGLHVPAPTVSGENGRWVGFAAMPGAASSLSLSLFEASTGARNGFDIPLATTGWGTGESDYVLGNFRATTPRALDVGILLGSGTESYVAESDASTFLATNPSGLFGPFTIPAGRVMDLREVTLPAGTQQVVLQDAGGGVDWGLSLHTADSTWAGKQVPAGQQMSWLNPVSAPETARVSVPASRNVLIAVWKARHSDLALAGSYRLSFNHLTGVDPAAPGAASGITAITPNPSRSTTTIEFQLARAGDVSLEVHDVSGALVRVIERGEFLAGHYVRSWDGRLRNGDRAPNGIYFVRLRAGDHSVARRLVRIE